MQVIWKYLSSHTAVVAVTAWFSFSNPSWIKNPRVTSQKHLFNVFFDEHLADHRINNPSPVKDSRRLLTTGIRAPPSTYRLDHGCPFPPDVGGVSKLPLFISEGFFLCVFFAFLACSFSITFCFGVFVRYNYKEYTRLKVLTRTDQKLVGNSSGVCLFFSFCGGQGEEGGNFIFIFLPTSGWY